MTAVQSTSTSIHVPGTQLIALYNYRGSTKGDLPFSKGETLHVVGIIEQDLNWLRARSADGREGLVPANYVAQHKGGPLSPKYGSLQRPNGLLPKSRHTLGSQVWYHGKITRERTELLLKDKDDGTFLIRDSTNFPGDYTLCVVCEGKIDHYRIYRRQNALFTCDDDEFFENLTLLVQHYKEDADGLSHKLTQPCPHLQSPTLAVDMPDRAVTSPKSPSTRTSPRPRSTPPLPSRVEAYSKQFKTNGWAIGRHEIKLKNTIGHGEFGDVLLGEYRGDDAAVKVLKQSSGVVENLLEEAMLMQSLKHKNLVNMLGVVLDDLNDIFLLTEYMANGNLVDYLRSRGRHALTKQMMLRFAIDVCAGMVYLEEKQLVHRDLAARNILLDANLVAKISDFGLARPSDQANQDAEHGKFPIKWTAPEALKYSRFSSKSDMWSFGILLWEIYSYGRVPYPRIPIQDVVRHIEKGYRMEPPQGCPKSVAALMTKAWTYKADDRPTFEQMLKFMWPVEAQLASVVTPDREPTVHINESKQNGFSSDEYEVTIDN